MLDFKHDRLKSQGVLRKEMGKTCTIPGCGKPLTHMQGPGSGVLCRDHQVQQREYGGTGRIDRKHTFHRKFTCDECGKDVVAEVKIKHPGLLDRDPDQFWRLCRARVIGDHKIRKADGGDDSADNIQTLCLDCNSDKTILNEDYRPGDGQ